MQAVILAAGKSSRFYPFTNVAHKALITIMGKTLLEHTLLSLKSAGISDVIIVVGENNAFASVIGDGKRLGLKITYVVQHEALGMGHALLQADASIKGDFFLLNAYHMDFVDFAKDMLSQLRRTKKTILLGKKPDGGEQYGFMRVSRDNVTGIIEKPKIIADDQLRIIGIYLLDKKFLETLRTTPLQHYHFEQALDTCAQAGRVSFVQTDKQTLTLKYAWDLLEIKNYLLKNLKHSVASGAQISKYAIITGPVHIDEGAQVFEGACIKGPVYLGKNVTVGTNTLVRNETVVEDNVVIGSYMEVRNSLIMGSSTTHSGFIGDSLIGSDCKIGAAFCSANVRLDRKNIATHVKENKVDSYRRHLGTIIGDNTIIGAGVITMPGTIIGNDSLIGPSTTVMENIPDNVKYYTEFKNTVKKENAKK